jgi:hypothetical protein
MQEALASHCTLQWPVPAAGAVRTRRYPMNTNYTYGSVHRAVPTTEVDRDFQ